MTEALSQVVGELLVSYRRYRNILILILSNYNSWSTCYELWLLYQDYWSQVVFFLVAFCPEPFWFNYIFHSDSEQNVNI